MQVVCDQNSWYAFSLYVSFLKMQVVYGKDSQIYRLCVIKVLTYTCMWSMFLFLHVCDQGS